MMHGSSVSLSRARDRLDQQRANDEINEPTYQARQQALDTLRSAENRLFLRELIRAEVDLLEVIAPLGWALALRDGIRDKRRKKTSLEHRIKKAMKRAVEAQNPQGFLDAFAYRLTLDYDKEGILRATGTSYRRDANTTKLISGRPGDRLADRAHAALFQYFAEHHEINRKTNTLILRLLKAFNLTTADTVDSLLHKRRILMRNHPKWFRVARS